MQVADRPVASRTDEFAELKRQLDVADADIALVNKRFDESQGMRLLRALQDGSDGEPAGRCSAVPRGTRL